MKGGKKFITNTV